MLSNFGIDIPASSDSGAATGATSSGATGVDIASGFSFSRIGSSSFSGLTTSGSTSSNS